LRACRCCWPCIVATPCAPSSCRMVEGQSPAASDECNHLVCLHVLLAMQVAVLCFPNRYHFQLSILPLSVTIWLPHNCQGPVNTMHTSSLSVAKASLCMQIGLLNSFKQGKMIHQDSFSSPHGPTVPWQVTWGNLCRRLMVPSDFAVIKCFEHSRYLQCQW